MCYLFVFSALIPTFCVRPPFLLATVPAYDWQKRPIPPFFRTFLVFLKAPQGPVGTTASPVAVSFSYPHWFKHVFRSAKSARAKSQPTL